MFGCWEHALQKKYWNVDQSWSNQDKTSIYHHPLEKAYHCHCSHCQLLCCRGCPLETFLFLGRECFGHRCNCREVLGDIVWRSCLQLNYVPLAVTYSLWKKKERKQKWHWINVRPHHREPFKEAWVMLAVHWCPRASMPEVLVCAGRDGLFVPELVYNFSWNFFLCHCESAACVCFLTIPRLACVLHFLKLSRRALQFQAMPLGRRLLQTGWNHGSCANELV